MGQGQSVDAGRAAAALGGRSIILVGMMGAGKTSVGKRLAAKLGLPFVDADAEIEAGAQLTISEIFERFGETYFREGERKVIARLLNGGPLVLATGGGAFMNATTRDNIARHGVSIWLKPSFDVLLARVRKKSNRPLLKTADPEQTLRRLLEERSPTYALADFTIESLDGSHDAVVDAILQRLHAALGNDAEASAAGEAPGGSSARRARLFDPDRGRRPRRGGGRNRQDCAGRQLRRGDRRQGRAALSRAARRKPGSSGSALYIDRLPAWRGRQVLCRVRPRRRCADRGAHRAARRRHRAWRRGRRRSCRILRRDAAPGRAPGADPDDAARSGRFQRRRQDGNQFAARKEPHRRLSSAVAGAGRHHLSQFPERARFSRWLRRSRQVWAHRRPGLFRVSGIELARRVRRRTSPSRSDRDQLRGQGARRRRRRNRAGRARAAQPRAYLWPCLGEADPLRCGAPRARGGRRHRHGLGVPLLA